MKDIDDRYSPPSDASSASTDAPSLQAMREILYLESLYADEIDYKSQMWREEPNLRAMCEILFLESLYGASIDYRSDTIQTHLGTTLRAIFSLGMLFLGGIGISLVLHWAMQWAMKAFGK